MYQLLAIPLFVVGTFLLMYEVIKECPQFIQFVKQLLHSFFH